MTTDLYSRPPNSGPDCSTARSARLRQRRFEMAHLGLTEPPEYRELAAEAREILLAHEGEDPALARALALRHVVEHCPITLAPDTLLIGGENPFFFNLMLPALQADAYSRVRGEAPTDLSALQRDRMVFLEPCFEGHITPGLQYILPQGLAGIRRRLQERARDPQAEAFCRAGLISCEAVLRYAERYREAALGYAQGSAISPPSLVSDGWKEDLRTAADWLSHVPEHPARTLAEALQSYWLVYILVTVEMGGCCPGGGLGLGRLDQFLYSYYRADLDGGRLTRPQALEILELFLLCFRHEDYYTGHQIYTPGSQASLGGVTPEGADASNELTELLMEASLRIQMPAPYLSLRLHRDAPERYWQVAANYVAGGLGFSVVNDEVLVPAFVRHGRPLTEARDYICSCCYENTIPGREAFNPNGTYLNLPLVLELALNEGRSLLTGEQLALSTPPLSQMDSFAQVLEAFRAQLHLVVDELTGLTNFADEQHCRLRRYPLMSLFIEDCIETATDVCAGGARYDLTGCIVSGLPNVVNSLAAVRDCVAWDEIEEALQSDFVGHTDLRETLLRALKWGNGDERVDDLARWVTDLLYAEFEPRRNARGGRWQCALYTFAANYFLGEAVGASADGRGAREMLTRNLNPTWGTDRHGPTAVLRSLSRIGFTGFPDGCALDLRFDPAFFTTSQGQQNLDGFLKAFCDLGVMQMQISMMDTETLLDAQEHPERYPELLVKVAGYSARFVDLDVREQAEVIARTAHGL